MDPGLQIAATGMVAAQTREDQLSNDIANASTPGYKVQRTTQQSFGALLLSNTSTGQPVGALDGGVALGRSVVDLTPASLQSTGQPLDFAITGDGFFAVRTSAGVRYTRNGQFSTSAAGQLVDGQGNPVLAQGGGTIRVAADGTVAASSLGVFKLTNVRPNGNDLYSGTAGGRATGTVRSGELEGSGVDAATTTTDMMATLQEYDADQKVLQTLDTVMQRSASSVGALGGA